MPSQTTAQGSSLELDAVIVGAGFSGIYVLQRLRDELKMKVKILEAGSRLAGVWNWNTYPGARVDSPSPTYGFDFEEVYKTYNWTELYPGQKEMQAYFEHVDKLLSIRKDCIFNTIVKEARFDQLKSRWTIQTNNGLTVVAKYFIPAVGGLSKQYMPQWKGIESFQGPICHSSEWPSEGIDVRGKRVAVIGTGSTGVQITQEWAKEAKETIVFQRTPNICYPLQKQLKLDPAEQEEFKKKSADMYSKFWATGNTHEKGTVLYFADRTPEEWEKFLKHLYNEGDGLSLWMLAIADWDTNPEANRFLYDFWARTVRERVHDPVKRDILAPLEPLYPYGSKRVVMEIDYYDLFNKPNLDLVDIRNDPIAEIAPHSIITQTGRFFEVDVIAVATGFDAGAGSLMKIDIRDTNNIPISERWKNGVLTFLGLMVPDFPNMFTPYGPQSPGELSNGSILVLYHACWIRDMIKKMENEGIRSIEPRLEVAQDWRDEVQANTTFLAQGRSWYNGWNIPDKPKELIYYICNDFPYYLKKCSDPLGIDFGKSFIST